MHWVSVFRLMFELIKYMDLIIYIYIYIYIHATRVLKSETEQHQYQLVPKYFVPLVKSKQPLVQN